MARSEAQLRADRVRYLMRKHGPDLLAKLEAGTPLRTALAALQVSPELEDDLSGRADVRAALARREEHLRAQLGDADKGKRDAALVQLKLLFGWREPGSTTVEQRFGAVLNRYREWCISNGHAAVFNVLHDLLHERKETAAEQRRARRLGR